jgi:NAD+ synthase
MSELDIQPDLVTEVLVSFVAEEVGSAGLGRAIVGLSGGIDSAVVAALCARALGPTNVVCVLLPYRTSTPSSAAHAELVAWTSARWRTATSSRSRSPIPAGAATCSRAAA